MALSAEGLIEVLDPQDLGGLDHVARDEHGHLRLADVDIGDVLRREVTKGMRGLGLGTTIDVKNESSKLRCAGPIPFDVDYTRDLGYCAAQFLLDGGTTPMVSNLNGRCTPISFKQMVSITAQSYQIARQYMIRLSDEDFKDSVALGGCAALAGLLPEIF